MKSRFIKQRQGNDCGIAAIATVLHKPYAEIRRALNGPIGRGGLYDYEMRWLMNHYGNWRIYRPYKYYSLADWAKRHPLCVVSVGFLFGDDGHAMAIVDGKLWCPTHGHDVADMDRRVMSAIIPNTKIVKG